MIPTVASCCCRFDLKTAGLILGALVGWLCVIALSDGVWEAIILLCLIFSIYWLVGIEKEDLRYLRPMLIISFVGLIALYTWPITFALLVHYKPESKTVQTLSKDYDANKLFHIVAFIFGVTFGTYFWIVAYSVYKHVKDCIENRETKFELEPEPPQIQVQS